MRAPTGFLLLVLATLALPSCSRPPEECAVVLPLVSSDDAALAALARGADAEPRALAAQAKRVADAEDQLASRMSSIRTGPPALAAAASDYATFARDVSAAARALASTLVAAADARDATDPANAEGLVPASQTALEHLRARCAIATPDCRAVDDARRPLTDPSFADAESTVQITALERTAAEIEALRLSDSGLEGDARAYADVLRRWAAQLRREDGVLARATDDEKRLSAALAREKPIEQQVHAVCKDR